MGQITFAVVAGELDDRISVRVSHRHVNGRRQQQNRPIDFGRQVSATFGIAITKRRYASNWVTFFSYHFSEVKRQPEIAGANNAAMSRGIGPRFIRVQYRFHFYRVVEGSFQAQYRQHFSPQLPLRTRDCNFFHRRTYNRRRA